MMEGEIRRKNINISVKTIWKPLFLRQTIEGTSVSGDAGLCRWLLGRRGARSGPPVRPWAWPTPRTLRTLSRADMERGTPPPHKNRTPNLRTRIPFRIRSTRACVCVCVRILYTTPTVRDRHNQPLRPCVVRRVCLVCAAATGRNGRTERVLSTTKMALQYING